MYVNDLSEVKQIYNENICYDGYDEQFSNIAIDGFNSFISRYFTASKYFLFKNTIVENQSFDDIFFSVFFDGKLCEESSQIFNEEGNMFKGWYLNKGYKYITDLISNLDCNNLDARLYSFIEYYDFSLRDAIEEDNIEVLADWLYKIPGVMKEEFQQFGFLFKKEEKIQCEEYELDMPSKKRRTKEAFYFDKELFEDYSMMPDINQALIA